MTMLRTMMLIATAVITAVVYSANSDSALTTEEIAGLIERAEPGAVIIVPPGVYNGNLKIKKSITLEGNGRVKVIGDGTGTVIEILAAPVILRGFEVRGSGNTIDREPAGIRAETGPVVIENNRLEDVLYGIDLRTASDSVVRGNVVTGRPLEVGRRGDGVRLWWSNNCTVESNVVHQTRDAVFWYSEGLHIRNNRVSGSRYGLHFMYSHRTEVEHNTLQDNSVGVYLMYSNEISLRGNQISSCRGPSGYGVGIKDCDDITIHSNFLTANRVGLYSDRAPFSTTAFTRIEMNVIAFNEIGLGMTPQTTRVEVLENGFLENEEQVAVLGRGDLHASEFSKDGRGNFWSDYAGFDRDGDGIGDLPYVSVSLFENLLSREPMLRLFVHSSAQHAIEFTARALPEMQPEPKFTDAAPLMDAPSVAQFESASQARWPMAVVALALVGIGGIAIGFSRRTSCLAREQTSDNSKEGRLT